MSFSSNRKNPVLLSNLTMFQIDELRKSFDSIPKMRVRDFSKILNKLSPIPADQIINMFHFMDQNDDGMIDDMDFLNYMLYECGLRRNFLNESLSYIAMTSEHASPIADLDFKNIHYSSTKLQGVNTIRHIHHVATPSVVSDVLQDGKFGLYVTPIGKSRVTFWRPDLRMVEWDLYYKSKELVELTPSLAPKEIAKGTKADLKREQIKVQKQGPDFDIVCLEDLELMICFQEFHNCFFVYGLKELDYRCKISSLPIEISRMDYVPSKGGVSRLFIAGSSDGFLIIEFLTSDNILLRNIDPNHPRHYKILDILSPSQIRMHKVSCHDQALLTKIQYYHLLLKNFVITSSLFDENNPGSTLVITEFVTHEEHPQFIDSILPSVGFQVKDSINTFIAEHTGALFSGGWDKIIRVWHVADVMEKDQKQRCHAQFIGHKEAIISLYYHEKFMQIISFSRDAVIIVWSYRLRIKTHTYSAAHLMPSLYKTATSYTPELPKTLPAFYFCPITESILLGAERLMAIPFGKVMKKKLMMTL